MIAMRCGDVSVGGEIRLAATFGRRFMGLMFRKRLPEGSGLLLMPCGSVHMCFMRMALDIVYMDAGFRVLAVQKALKPWRLGALVKGAKLVLELPEGRAERCGVRPGMTLKVEPALAGERLTIEEKREMHGYKATGSCWQS